MAQPPLTSKGPKFVHYFWPVIKALQELGGSGTPSEVIERVAKNENVPEEIQKERLKAGGLRFNNQIHWVRQYLIWGGLLASSERGIWSLTEEGRKLTSFPYEKALALFRNDQLYKKRVPKQRLIEVDTEPEEEPTEESSNYKAVVLERLRTGLTPKGFEHFCMRLLREHGFEGLNVTGGPKDKGIDGDGILKLNPFMSFRVVFQCKRYAEAVASSHIATFRGSIPSSADKGIMLTTGYFTPDAIKMAQEPALKPIELIDGDQLVKLMEKMKLGLKPTYVVDEDFFDDFEETRKK